MIEIEQKRGGMKKTCYAAVEGMGASTEEQGINDLFGVDTKKRRFVVRFESVNGFLQTNSFLFWQGRKYAVDGWQDRSGDRRWVHIDATSQGVV